MLDRADRELGNKYKMLEEVQDEVNKLIESVSSTQEIFKAKMSEIKKTVSITSIPLNAKEVELQHDINCLQNKVTELKGKMKEECSGFLKEKRREAEVDTIILKSIEESCLSGIETRLRKW
eukprot:TRINITY_DN10643_c0_g3_i2.p2 TRINITY_DN10643_c0_g3~~TRINITY_DN10643_c0_g3_i2.p2  ORF type:complete len:121 (-),score=23.77 TRINITY_DN10643_c0_g3_i2:197-559(-)